MKRPFVVDIADVRAFDFVWPTRTFLDGKEMDAVIRATVYSDGHGELLCYRKDENGNHILNADRTGVEKEILRGQVRIVRPGLESMTYAQYTRRFQRHSPQPGMRLRGRAVFHC